MNYDKLLRCFRECKPARLLDDASVTELLGDEEQQTRLMDDLFRPNGKKWELYTLDVHQLKGLLKKIIAVLERANCEISEEIYDLYLKIGIK